jgi:sarcosine/dimethylglycine N-methyltransferase
MSAPGVVGFYDHHPISEAQVVAALRRRGKVGPRLAPEDLYEWDQDHYGGVAAVDALARRAEIGAGSGVLDVCAGLGGPARFIAHRFGARVTGVDLTASRCAGARRLSRLVGLERRVRMVNGDAQRLPFRAHAFTAVVSQEGLLHVPDKAAALGECARVLIPGGRIAFTDWVSTSRLDDGERRRLAEWMEAVTIQSAEGYRALLGRAGFGAIAVEDLSAEWIDILRERLAMYRGLRVDTVARLGQARYDQYDQLYAFFVGLVTAGKLGGARFSGRCDRGIA